MSSLNSWQKFVSFLHRRWADVLASDLAAGHGFEPELSASTFVHLEGNPPRPAHAGGAAAPQRSARISSNRG